MFEKPESDEKVISFKPNDNLNTWINQNIEI